MPGYGKIFSSTFTGSMYGSGPVVFALWSYVLANAWNGEVEINPHLVAACLGATSEEIQTALEVLCAEDPDSRNPEEGGRRLIKVATFLYRVVSWEQYHTMRNDEDRKEQNRLAQVRCRARKSGTDEEPPPKIIPASNGTAKSAPPKFVPPLESVAQKFFMEHGSSADEGSAFWRHFENCDWKLSGGRGGKMKDWKLAAQNWIRNNRGKTSIGKMSAKDQLASITADLDAEGFMVD